MGVTRRRMQVPVEAVFAVLSDGKSYGEWVVGTRMIRSVDPGWPAAGTRLHYTAGYGPLRKDDETRSVAGEANRRLELEVHAWPAGSARVEFTIEPQDGGLLVSIDEHPLRGPARTLHNPIFDALISLRNKETLRRLERHAARRAASS